MAAGLVIAFVTPATYTARSLVVIGEDDPAMQSMVPEIPGMQLLPATASLDRLSDLLSRGGPPRVIQVGLQDTSAASAAAELRMLLNTYTATAQDAAERVARTAADMADNAHALDGLRQQAGVTDWDEDARDASHRVGDLARQLDDAQQQATAATAGAKAARQMLAGQPGSVLDFRETAATPPSDPAHTLLLGLLMEREHLIAQYTPDFPAVREINGKIETIRNAIASDAKAQHPTVREIRNPVADQLSNQASAASVRAAEAGARLDVIQHQLEGARARTAQIGSIQPKLHELQRLRTALENVDRQQRDALQAMRPLGGWSAPVIDAVDYTAGFLVALGGLLLGTLSAAFAWLVRRRSSQRVPPRFQVARRPMQVATPQPALVPIEAAGAPVYLVKPPVAPVLVELRTTVVPPGLTVR